MKELEKEIVTWHKKAFPNVSEGAVLDKVWEECDEFDYEVMFGDITESDYKNELSDVIITHIVYYARFHNLSLEDVVRGKFEQVKKKYGGE